MAIVTGYTSLLSEAASWLARGDLTSAIPGFVQNFEERFFRNRKNFGPWMETALSVAISTTAAVPSDYLGLKIAYLSGQSAPPLDVRTLEQLLLEYPRTGTGGKPKRIARDGANFVFGPVPGSGYTLAGTYYAKPVVLRSFAGDAAAHYLVVNAPDLLLYGTLMEAQPHVMRDTRFPLWQAKYDEAINEYRDLMRAQSLSGGALQMVVA